jgi:hypothetical protein
MYINPRGNSIIPLIFAIVLSTLSLTAYARDSLEALRSDLNATNAKVTELQNQISGLQSQNTAQQTQINTLQDKIDSRRGIYEIGDIGPAGGIVFFVYGDNGFGTHGLEAAPEDQVTPPCPPLQCPRPDVYSTVIWGLCNVPATENQHPGIGSGAQFTTAILAACNQENIAAKLASDYTLNGFDDWYLPSTDELAKLYMQKDVVGGFYDDLYWSSQQSSGEHALLVDFGRDDDLCHLGNCADFTFKGRKNRVRAIRTF